MNNFFKAGPKLFVVEQDLGTTKKTVKEKVNVNHIFVYDRSGSMSGVLRDLCEDLKKKYRTVDTGDTITIGWFSSEREFGWAIKGFKVTDKKDFTNLDKVVNANNTVLGTTCFSEILADTKTVVKDLTAFSTKFSLCFFTDGHPVVSNYEKELKDIDAAIKDVAGSINSTLMVGYGNYYNKELMAKMASQFGGALVHSSDINTTFSPKFSEFLNSTRDTQDKIQVDVEGAGDAIAVFTLNEGQVNLHELVKGSISYAPTTGVNSVFTIATKAPKNADQVSPTSVMANTATRMTRALYAAALVLTQRTRADLAMEVLSSIGDKGLVDRLSSAFTNAEFGAVEADIQAAVADPRKSTRKDSDVGCLPKADAFCVLDVMDMLTADTEAEFYPFHEDFHYTRIGVKSKTRVGFPEFEADKTSRVPMAGLVWNDTKLNLSIRTKINGTVALLGNPKKLGLPPVVDTFIWRNFTVIKDGFLNVTVLPTTLSKESYDKLLDEGVIDKEHSRHYKGRVYPLHLDRLPVINRKVATTPVKASDLCKKVLEETKLMAHLKALNYLKDQVEPESAANPTSNYTVEQDEFLKNNGITKSGFNPPVDKVDATDFYMAKEFEVRVRGMSSIPKVDDVKARVAAKKALTGASQFVIEGLDLGNKALKNGDVETLKTTIAAEKKALNEVRSDIQRTKFAVSLAKCGFSDVNIRTRPTLVVDNTTFELNLGEVKVEV